MSINIPVFFTHYGNPYVEIAVRQAQQYNSRVVLLGDEFSEITNVEYYPYQQYANQKTLHMVSVYQHMHTNPNVAHRRYGYLRFFHVLNFMKDHQLQRIFLGDSDLLLYTDVTKIADAWGTHEVLLCIPLNQPEYRWSVSAHASYWTYERLSTFCDFVLQMYTTNTGLQRLQEKWQWHQDTNTPGGICSMTLLYLFCQQYPKLVGNLLRPTGLPSHAFDLSINTAENLYLDEYEAIQHPDAPHGKFKQIEWKDQQPYGYNLRLQQTVHFDGLHYQGGAKSVYGYGAWAFEEEKDEQ